MDVKFFGCVARWGGAALAVAVLGLPVSAADDANTMVIVTATDAATEVALPPVAEPSDLVIHIIDDAPPAAPVAASAQAATPAARGELTVVANAARTSPAATLIADPAVIPAGSVEGIEGSRLGGVNWGRVLGSGPRRPSPMAGIQMPQRTGRYDAPQYDEQSAESFAPQDEPPAAYEPPASAASSPVAPAPVARLAEAAAAPAMAKIKSPAEHARNLLVQAYQLSLSASNEGEYSQIIQWCASAARSGLDEESRQFGAQLSSWSLNRRGQCRADEGQHDLALADFRAALEFDANNWRALHNRAVTYAQNGQFAEAFDDFCRVIQINPQHAKAYSNRATLYVQAGEFEKALADYDAALAIDAELLPALVGRGRLCHLQGQLDEALGSLDAAVVLAPKDAEIVCSRADLLADLGRYEDALMDYAQAIDLNSKFEHAYRNGAWLLATCPEERIRDVEGAIVGAQAALECGYGERHAALDTLAAALANAGRFDEAVGTIQQAIDVAPEEARAGYLARQQLYETGQPFRTSPVNSAATVDAAVPADEAQSAVYIEE